MKRLLILVLLVPGSLAALWAQPQQAGQYRSRQKIKPAVLDLEIRGLQQAGKQARIDYTIPYDGLVEIRLYNERQKILWQAQFVQASGENTIPFHTKSLKPGTYRVVLIYKGLAKETALVIAAQAE
ncbi:MAG: hypothetical protein LW884_06305 [Bacteroidetes bacterium]|jgi:hypothetical protein|nr:hypothetical protein [Bacteroidota bacterium]